MNLDIDPSVQSRQIYVYLGVRSYSIINAVTEIDLRRDFVFPVASAEVIHTHIWLNKYSYKLH